MCCYYYYLHSNTVSIVVRIRDASKVGGDNVDASESKITLCLVVH